MGKLFGMMSRGFILFCVATLITQVFFLMALAAGGALTKRNQNRLLAIMRGVDLDQLIEEEKAAELKRQTDAQDIAPSPEMLGRKKATRSKIDELQLVESRLRVIQSRFQLMQNEFDQKLSQLELNARDHALTELKTTLELLDAKQAKKLLVHLIKSDKMDDVVEVVRRMNSAKQRKLFDEFRSDSEQQHVHDILRRLRKSESVAQNE